MVSAKRNENGNLNNVCSLAPHQEPLRTMTVTGEWHLHLRLQDPVVTDATQRSCRLRRRMKKTGRMGSMHLLRVQGKGGCEELSTQYSLHNAKVKG